MGGCSMVRIIKVGGESVGGFKTDFTIVAGVSLTPGIRLGQNGR